MLPLIPLVTAGVQAGTALAGYFGRNKTPNFENTALGRYYAKMAKEGAISPTARRTLMGQYGMEAGNIAANRKAETRGLLEAGGIGGRSVAGIGLLNAPGAELQAGLGRQSANISLLNEESKRSAGLALAEGKTSSRLQRGAEKSQARMGLLSGLGNAAGSLGQYAQSYLDSKKLDKLINTPAKGEDGRYNNAYDRVRLGLDAPWSQSYRAGEADIRHRNALADQYGKDGQPFDLTDDELYGMSATDLLRLSEQYGIPYEVLLDAQDQAYYSRMFGGQ